MPLRDSIALSPSLVENETQGTIQLVARSHLACIIQTDLFVVAASKP